MVGSVPQTNRTNVLEAFYILSRGNQNGVPTWFGVGYAVGTNSPSGSLYPLYRFATNHPVAAFSPAFIFTNDFINFLANVNGGSHLMDGVVALTVRAYESRRLLDDESLPVYRQPVGHQSKCLVLCLRLMARSGLKCSATRAGVRPDRNGRAGRPRVAAGRLVASNFSAEQLSVRGRRRGPCFPPARYHSQR